MHLYPIHRYCVWLGACWTLPSRKPGSNAKTLHMRRGARLFAKYSPFSLIWGDTLCTLTCLWQLRLLHKYIFSIFRVKWLWKSTLVRLAHNKILSDAFLMHSECVWRGAKMYLLAKAAMHFPHSFPRLSDFSLYCATATPRNSINAFRFPFAKCDTVVWALCLTACCYVSLPNKHFMSRASWSHRKTGGPNW